MRYVIGFIFLVHGLIHIMGFMKAFSLGDISQLSQTISKPLGILWLLTAILLLVSCCLFLLGKTYWPIVAILGVLLSQLLIMLVWKDARFGTVVNLLLIVICIPAYGKFRFDKMVRSETSTLFQGSPVNHDYILREQNIEHLPPIVQQWMQYSGVVGRKPVRWIRLKQNGTLRRESGGKWIPFRATQYFDAVVPGFVWSAEAHALPFIDMTARDKLYEGKGEMLIKLASIIPIVDEKDNKKIDSGTALRYLAEVCWFPSAALNPTIRWEQIEDNSVKAYFTQNDQEVFGIFKFSPTGKIISFEALRYYGAGKNAALETWLIEILDFRSFNGFILPNRCQVTWQLDDRDFTWLQFEVTDLDYDIPESF